MTDLQIKSTTDYDQFKMISGNRTVKPRHTANLTASIAHNNLLSVNPIIVNEQLEVIDGQHRLEVARNNNLPIYYVVVPNAALEEVVQLNVNVRAWVIKDYLDSYVQQGNENYIALAEFIERHKLTIASALELIGTSGGKNDREFKRGNFVFEHREEAEAIAEAYGEMKPYCESDLYRGRDFVRALKLLAVQVPVIELIRKLEVSGRKIEPEATSKGYLRQFEDILNWKARKDFVRLY